MDARLNGPDWSASLSADGPAALTLCRVIHIQITPDVSPGRGAQATWEFRAFTVEVMCAHALHVHALDY
ncbi:hypothetical protein EVAR_19575_1 [Eumeta japonica]|uniref:Uncharacterized protein n=1 Tax=Eumeta variegata TaxID=151549 RepID=A0A4C1UFA0_EUMVA|nr:hypothetical protein EVAR_19575_1 [Eumeta japonica]